MFLIAFLVIFCLRLFEPKVQSTIGRYWAPLMLIGLFVCYWLIQLFVLYQHDLARSALNQLRPLLYYLFLFFLLVKIHDEDDIKNVIKAFCVLVIPTFIVAMAFIVVHKNPSIKSFLKDMTPDAIARFLGEPAGTIRSRLHRANNLLRKELQALLAHGENACELP